MSTVSLPPDCPHDGTALVEERYERGGVESYWSCPTCGQTFDDEDLGLQDDSSAAAATGVQAVFHPCATDLCPGWCPAAGEHACGLGNVYCAGQWADLTQARTVTLPTARSDQDARPPPGGPKA